MRSNQCPQLQRSSCLSSSPRAANVRACRHTPAFQTPAFPLTSEVHHSTLLLFESTYILSKYPFHSFTVPFCTVCPAWYPSAYPFLHSMSNHSHTVEFTTLRTSISIASCSKSFQFHLIHPSLLMVFIMVFVPYRPEPDQYVLSLHS